VLRYQLSRSSLILHGNRVMLLLRASFFRVLNMQTAPCLIYAKYYFGNYLATTTRFHD